jgi:hypothetical protein
MRQSRELGKWLRQQTKDFYAAGFGALVKRWDLHMNVGGGYVEKYMFFPVSNIKILRFMYIIIIIIIIYF